ncbi:histone deacetylase [Iamia sp. SCSIO 61187]|uniref:hypothetical protein n=1 Tax=Iamia sp. SCSIO 61187 TaxID=2722752 RepID=UPI001C63510F|nr:hypothetical protein [Iamia sp. SCSIO 61187]QYG92152.1 histone deacetylase [Iamia sp. SCSIO 61187]
MTAPLVWYVAYGSNRSADRLRAYLAGASGPDAPYGAHRGCGDPTPPRADRWLALDRRVTFRGTSRRWGGGVAFLDLDPTPGTETPARAWLLALDQVADLVAQEARLATAPHPDALGAIPPGGRFALGGGWYDTVLRLSDVEGRPALTVTTAQPLPATEPTSAYLSTLAAGLAEQRTDGRGQTPSVGRSGEGDLRSTPPPGGGARAPRGG